MGHTILLADDSITIQKVIELTFSDEDFELHTVGNGQKAIEELRKVKPDIVLCDIIMPEKNGYEVCEYIKSEEDLKHIPVLLLTGAFEPFDQERARKAGCDGFLAKPFEPQTLISKVKELLLSAEATERATPPEAMPAMGTAPAPLATPSPTLEGDSEAATVMVSPPEAPAAPAPQPDEAPTGPTVPTVPTVDEGFAVEAGERALSVERGDETVLLGQDEAVPPSSAPAEPPTTEEDIWKEMQEVPPAPPDTQVEAEGADVIMAPEEAAPEQSGPPFGPSEEAPPQSVREMGDLGAPPEETPAASSSDAWVMERLAEEEEPVAAPEPELTPQGEFGGFDDFAAEQAPEPPEAGAPAEPSVPVDTLKEMPPSGDVTPPPSFEMAPESAPSSPSLTPPASPQPVSQTTSQDMDELVERVARKVVAKLSEKAVQDIAWEVVPDLAESLIQKEIDALKAKIPK
ncbi:MAG: response regulator [Acidobacteriota bacterium]